MNKTTNRTHTHTQFSTQNGVLSQLSCITACKEHKWTQVKKIDKYLKIWFIMGEKKNFWRIDSWSALTMYNHFPTQTTYNHFSAQTMYDHFSRTTSDGKNKLETKHLVEFSPPQQSDLPLYNPNCWAVIMEFIHWRQNMQNDNIELHQQRELISTWKTSHQHNKDLNWLQ